MGTSTDSTDVVVLLLHSSVFAVFLCWLFGQFAVVMYVVEGNIWRATSTAWGAPMDVSWDCWGNNWVFCFCVNCFFDVDGLRWRIMMYALLGAVLIALLSLGFCLYFLLFVVDVWVCLCVWMAVVCCYYWWCVVCGLGKQKFKWLKERKMNRDCVAAVSRMMGSSLTSFQNFCKMFLFLRQIQGQIPANLTTFPSSLFWACSWDQLQAPCLVHPLRTVIKIKILTLVHFSELI